MNSCASDKIGKAKILVSITAPAFFVYLEVTTPAIKSYSFSENGFMQFSSTKIVDLTYQSNETCKQIKNELDIQVLTMNNFIRN